MELRIFVEPQQGASYEQQRRVALAAEALGFDAFFRSDHYLAMNAPGLPGPTDAWTTLAGLAVETTSIKLGTLMTSATFRHPGPFAIQVAQVDQMSHGRVELGIGAGWFAEEHAAYAIPFPDVKERFARLEETLEIVTGLWATPVGERFDYEGKHFQLTDSPALAKPTQRPRPPILIGGSGKKRTPALAARFADEFNVPFDSLENTATYFGRVREACQAINRDPATLTYSNALVLCAGRNEAELHRRSAAISRDITELRENGLAGTPDEIVDKIGRYRELGTTRFYLQFLDLGDLDQLELVADRIAPQLD